MNCFISENYINKPNKTFQSYIFLESSKYSYTVICICYMNTLYVASFIRYDATYQLADLAESLL